MKFHAAVCTLMLVGASLAQGANPPAPAPARAPSPAAQAAKALSDARAADAKAREAVDAIRHRVEARFETRREWKTAHEAVDNAHVEYDNLLAKTLEQVRKTPEYKENLVKRDKAQAVIDAGSKSQVSTNDDVKVTSEDVNQAQQDRIAAVLAMKKMEREGEQNDARLIAARQKVKDAEAAWDALQPQVDEAMKQDPAYPAAQQALDQADQALQAAKDQYAAAQKGTVAPRKH